MKYVDIRGLPPCSFSPQCLRLLDDLDLPSKVRTPAHLAHITDLQDERQLRQIRSHVPGCPTCSALLAEARHTRTEQRAMLHNFLIANEKRVPATTAAIFVALRREQEQQESATRHRYISSRDVVLAPLTARQARASGVLPIPLHSRISQPRKIWQNVFTLATVFAVILAAIGLISSASDQPATLTYQAPQPRLPKQPGPALAHSGWDSVVIGLTLLSTTGLAASFTIYNFNSANERFGTLVPASSGTSDTRLEEISSDGQSLLYDTLAADQQRSYATVSASARTRILYHLSAGLAGNAIWMDNNHVLVQNTRGSVVELDAHSGAFQHAWSLEAGRLTFYEQPFLYFTTATMSTLYRVNLALPRLLPQRVAEALPNTRFWLSPDGTTIFYANKRASSSQGIYAVSSDGTHLRLLRSGSGLPIGYADDNALMLLQQVGTQLQVIKLGATAQQKEQVVLADAAPHASSLCGPGGMLVVIAVCDQNVALAPYGHGLLLHVYYADGSHSLVYDDLTAGTSRKVFNVPSNAQVQLPGWSRMSATTAFRTPSTLCA